MFDSIFIDRFNLKWKIVCSGCWIWTAAKMPKGYGQMKLPKTRKQEYAHRLAYMIHFGEIPDGKHVCHKCDNPSCVNPDHLFLGTAWDNLNDMKIKGRHLYGEKNTQSILTDEAVRKIKQLISDGQSQSKIAAMFNVHQVTISKIHRGLRWQHIK